MLDHRADSPLANGRAVINHVKQETHSLLETAATDRGQTDIAIWEQGDEAFTTPAMNTHFLALVLGGSAVTEIDFDARTGAKQAMIEVGSLCYVPAGSATSVMFDGRFRTVHMMLAPGLFDAEVEDAVKEFGHVGAPMGFVSEHNPTIAAACLDLLRQTSTRNDPLTRSTLEHALARKLVRYVTPGRYTGDTCDALSDVQLKQAVDYIEARVFEDFDLSDIATFVNAPVPALIRSFEDEVGLSPARFRMERQIDHVRTCLDSSQSVPAFDVARLAGFDSVADLDSAFMSVMGIGFENYRRGAFC